ncbi:MAG: SPFH domain-containing protein [Actinomycetota bacterium]
MMQERNGFSISGWFMIVVEVVLFLLGFAIAAGGAADGGSGAAVVFGTVLVIAAAVGLMGFFMNQPNHARVLVLVGRYVGTVRNNGFQWTNPLVVPANPSNGERNVSLRVRTFDSDVLKVNDAVGNPVEIAAVITWLVRDTARALFDVDNYQHFVAIQTEAGVRHVASEYPYDSYDDDRPSLRSNADEVAETLQRELQERLQVAGVTIVDCRLRRLAYAPEIAGEMLRRQQASAVVAARQLIVDGAVGMVRHALDSLVDQGIVDLDEERKATMVSNLLVVLTSDRGVQPIVNAGSIYS